MTTEFQELSFLFGICPVPTKSYITKHVTINKSRDGNCNPHIISSYLLWKDRADSEHPVTHWRNGSAWPFYAATFSFFFLISSTYHSSHFPAIKKKHYLFMFPSTCTELSQAAPAIYITQMTYWWKYAQSKLLYLLQSNCVNNNVQSTSKTNYYYVVWSFLKFIFKEHSFVIPLTVKCLQTLAFAFMGHISRYLPFLFISAPILNTLLSSEKPDSHSCFTFFCRNCSSIV